MTEHQWYIDILWAAGIIAAFMVYVLVTVLSDEEDR